jgi:RNA polymerase sigma-70 factor (ECF subfamily)
MRWRVFSIRQAADFPRDGEAALRALPGLGGTGLGGVELAGAGLGGPGLDPSLAEFSAKHGGSRAESRPNGAAKGNSGPEMAQEIDETAQPSGVGWGSRGYGDPGPGQLGSGSGRGSRPGDRRCYSGSQVSLDPASDAAIMLRVAAGDEAGFNYLVGKYHRAMIHFLFRMVRNQAIAEELAQEVFLRVYRSRESYRAEAKFTTWLYRIATNLAVNHARDTRHERSAQTIYLDAPDEENGTKPDVADDEPSVEQRMMRDERMAAIRTHVMALPERQRMAVLMHKYQGMDYRQIGEVLKLSESATKSLLFRAYQTLRDKLKDFV